jgi:hypothetical protein
MSLTWVNAWDNTFKMAGGVCGRIKVIAPVDIRSLLELEVRGMDAAVI